MDKKASREILIKLSQEFYFLQELARELGDIVFPCREGLFTGTYH
jgi:hypothetical protein